MVFREILSRFGPRRDRDSRRFNQPDGAMLFQFLKQPISYHQYTGRKRERIGVNDRMQWEDLGGGTARSSASREGAFPSMRVGSTRDDAPRRSFWCERRTWTTS